MYIGRRRVVVTGMGAVTPLGDSVDEYWKSLVKGKSGIGPMTLADPTEYPCKVAGEIPDFDPGTYINPRKRDEWLAFADGGGSRCARLGGFGYQPVLRRRRAHGRGHGKRQRRLPDH